MKRESSAAILALLAFAIGAPATPAEPSFDEIDVEIVYRQRVRTSDEAAGNQPRVIEAIRAFPPEDVWVRKQQAGWWGKTQTEARPEIIPDLGIIWTSGPSRFAEGPAASADDLPRFARIATLRSLELDFLEIGDAGMEALERTGLSELSAGNTSLTDAALASIATLIDLKVLALHDNEVSDAGLRRIAALQNLEELYLGGTRVTGSAFRHLRGLTALQVLYLHGTPLDDDGLAAVCELRGLRTLCLSETAIGDRGVSAIAQLVRLEELDLGCTRITDRALADVARCRTLRNLYLDGTAITDKGLDALKGLESLRRLDISQTRISAAAADGFRDAHPRTTVVGPTEQPLSPESLIGTLGMPSSRRRTKCRAGAANESR